MLRSIFGVLACSLLLGSTSAHAVSLSFGGGYGVLGSSGKVFGDVAPFARFELGSDTRVTFLVNSTLFFEPIRDVEFSQFTHNTAWTGDTGKRPLGNLTYSVGAELRGILLPMKRKNNVYLGFGADWLPQLETYYPGIKLTLGYQLSFTKILQFQIGAEYYIYGVIPFNEANLVSSFVVVF